METHFTTLDGAVLVGYFTVVMAAGLYFWKKSRSVEGFTAAGRSLPGWVVGLSILATYVSSISFLALPGKAFASNWNPFVFSLSLPIAAWIAVRWFIPYYRNSHEISAYSHLEHRFGTWARIYAGLCYLLTQVVRMGTVMYLMALPLNVLLGWDTKHIILVTGISVTIYTFVGGIVAVIWTDAIQCVILMAGALLCALLMVYELPEGPQQLFRVAPDADKFSLGSFGTELDAPTFWVVLAYGIVMNLTNFGIDQNYVQRYIAARSDSDAKKSLWLGGLTYIPLSALFFFIGTTLFVYYSTHQLPQAYRNEPDNVFPYFIVTALPPGVTGLLIAAVFAAAMSTVSTSLNSSVTLLLSDYSQRYINGQASERQSMLFLYGTTVVWGALGTLIGLAIAISGQKSALDAWWVMSGIFSGGMIGLFLLGMISKRADNAAAVTAVCVGVLVIMWMTASNITGLGEKVPALSWLEGTSPFHNFMIPVIGTVTIVLLGFLYGQFLGEKSAAVSTPRD
jgi:SSS family solute:Na+ symporter